MQIFNEQKLHLTITFFICICMDVYPLAINMQKYEYCLLHEMENKEILCE